MRNVLLATGLIASSFTAHAANLTTEELRIEKAASAMPNVVTAFSDDIASFNKEWQGARNYQQASDLIDDYSKQLWRKAKTRISQTNSYDDRELYWARLLSSKIIRTEKPLFTLSNSEQSALLTMLENGSRGRTDLDYSKKTDKKILITGFDPFLLDRNINQSNPSGVAALLLDGQVINHNGVTAEINAVMIPVRYEDFDQGIIESLLAPYYALNNVDMVATISMGGKDFDLERFPGKRRSVTAPDNANIVYGGTATAPKISSLNDRPLPGNEFVQFSLPVKQMQKATGPFTINDNHKVVTLEKAFEPKTLKELEGAIAVKGGGGGYLSNEISYRSIRLRDELNSDIPTGHIHTPRIAQFEPETEAKIVKQIQAMLEQSLSAI
jgi:pyrrolidone-carboxylate peptidase